MEDEKEPKFDQSRLERFPWVSHEEFIAHYSSSLTEFLDMQFRLKDSKTHITDLSASAAAFADAWWCIFDNIDYKE